LENIRERLDRILEGQHGGGPEGDIRTAYLCLGFWLGDADLEAIRPQFSHDEDDPDVGEVGRYRGVPVFQESTRPVKKSPWGFYGGIWFAYLPCLHVD
jgi:hypothetical protein